MLGQKDDQSDFFEGCIASLVPENHILLRIGRKIDFSPTEERLASLYSDKMGRPSYPPLVLFKMLLLEYFYNLSDVKISQECQYNLLFRRFIGLKVSKKVPDDTTLVVFRKRLGEKVFKELFDLIVTQAKEKGLTGEELGIVDASAIKANICEFNGINILRQARRHLVRAVEKETGKEFEEKETYLTKERATRKPEPKELAEEKKKTQELIKKIKGKYGKAVEAKVALVEEILATPEEEIPEVKSIVDPDARYGKTSPQKSFTGYKVAISYDKDSGIISSCDFLSGNQNEGKNCHFERLIKADKEKGVKYKAVAADGAYDSLKNRKAAHREGMKAFFSSRRKEKHLDRFRYDEATRTIKCTQGHQPIGSTEQEDGRLYYYSANQCGDCPDGGICPGKVNMGRKRVFLSQNYVEKIKDGGEERKEALKLRKLIEKKFGEAKKWHGLERARYWGKTKVGIQALLTFIVINLKRIANLLENTGGLTVTERVMG